MVTLDDLRRIHIFSDMTDAMLEQVRDFTTAMKYEKEQVIYDEKSEAEHLHAVKYGRVILEADLSP
ncbi:hypothetical protein ACFL0Q_05035, partial [Thermodesulfobacteriota bacterium]